MGQGAENQGTATVWDQSGLLSRTVQSHMEKGPAAQAGPDGFGKYQRWALRTMSTGTALRPT